MAEPEQSNGGSASEKGWARRVHEVQKGISLQHCGKGGSQRLTVLGISPSPCLMGKARLGVSSSQTRGQRILPGKMGCFLMVVSPW